MMDHQYILPPEEETPKNHFPIIAQLTVLALILGGLFGSLVVNSDQPLSVSETLPPTQTNASAIAPAEKIDDVSLRATAAYVWDVQGQRALYSKNADEVLPLASITKLMTTLLAHELVADNTQATVSDRAIRQEGSSGLSAGEQFVVGDLQQLALVTSSNDAAFELGATVGTLLGARDPASQFITGMNIRADELGLETLEFRNTTGLDLSTTEPGAVGSARDISFLMEYIITHYPDLLEPTTASAARVYNATGEYHDMNNTNVVALDIPNLLGSKTGYTDLAGGNLTVAFDAGLNRPIVITVLGSTYDERFTDVLALVAAVQASLGHIEQ